MRIAKVALSCWLASALIALAAAPVEAAPIVYTDRAAWAAAAGGAGDLTENFNSFSSDVVYGASTHVSAGFLTLSVDAATSDDSWRIDALPAAFGSIPDVNGSSFATTLHHVAYGGTRLSFAPVRAIGFDYAGASYSLASGTLTTSLGDSVAIAASSNANRGFIGLIYTGGETFTSLSWGSSSAFAAGIDNVEAFSASQVPDGGTTMVLMGTALLGLAAGRRYLRGA